MGGWVGRVGLDGKEAEVNPKGAFKMIQVAKIFCLIIQETNPLHVSDW